MVVKNTRAATLVPIIQQQVESGSMVYTDSLPSYNALKADFVHDAIDHAEYYVKGAVHGNSMENFWSLLKPRSTGHMFRSMLRTLAGMSMSKHSDSMNGERMMRADSHW